MTRSTFMHGAFFGTDAAFFAIAGSTLSGMHAAFFAIDATFFSMHADFFATRLTWCDVIEAEKGCGTFSSLPSGRNPKLASAQRLSGREGRRDIALVRNLETRQRG